jgi:V/A-type H+-transporting ATPase subunit E
MQSVEKITARILSEAEAAAKAVIDEARSSADAALKEQQSKADAIIEKAKNDAQPAAVEQKKRRLSVIDLELRKQVLATRRQLLDDAFNKALNALVSMPAEQQIAAMAPRIIAAAPKGEGEILLTKNDAMAFGERLLAASKELYKKAGVDCKLVLSQKHLNAGGGFILKLSDVEYNNTYEALLKASQEELESKVAAVLFADEVSTNK